MRTNQEFPLPLIVGVLLLPFFLVTQVVLDVFKDQHSARLYQLFKRQRIFCLVNFALEHRIEILQIDVCIFDQSLSRLSHKHNFDAFVNLVQQQVNNLQNEVRLHRQQNFRIHVRKQALLQRLQEPVQLLVVVRQSLTRCRLAEQHAVHLL